MAIYLRISKNALAQEIRNDLEHIDARAVGLKKIGRKEFNRTYSRFQKFQ